MRIVQVDAFSAAPFAGNPAAVCVLRRPAPERWMRAVAREMNLSETAFLVRRGDAFDLRWFTPATEVDLCGHATLAGAHVLWESGELPPEAAARFDTLSGRLVAVRDGDWIEMDFPAEPAEEIAPPADLVGALGVEPRWTGRNRMDYLVEVADEAAVRAVRPDFGRLREATGRGVMVTAPSASPERDFVSRFFAPAAGIDEDPVTGSAHCCLGPYWAGRLGLDDLVGHQLSARGGIVRVRPRGERVLLRGRAVTVLVAELTGRAADPLETP